MRANPGVSRRYEPGVRNSCIREGQNSTDTLSDCSQEAHACHVYIYGHFNDIIKGVKIHLNTHIYIYIHGGKKYRNIILHITYKQNTYLWQYTSIQIENISARTPLQLLRTATIYENALYNADINNNSSTNHEFANKTISHLHA